MNNKPAKIMVIVTVALVIFVVAAVLQVFKDDSEQRYQGVQSNQSMEMEASSVVEQAASPVNEVVDVVKQAVDDAPEVVAEVSDQAVEVVKNMAVQAKDSVDAAEADVKLAVTQTESEAAQIHIVTAVGLKYDPMVTIINPGDMVAWENMPSHDTQSLEGLIPEGAEAWHSPLGENFQRKFTVEGIYIYKCTPHFGAGMGGAIIVGKPVNLDQIKRVEVKGAAKRLVKKALQAAESM